MGQNSGPPACHPDRRYFAKELCKPCYRHAYHIANLEKEHRLAHRYYVEHREQILEYTRQWATLNRDKIRRYHREYDLRNRPRRRKIWRRWYLSHRDSFRESRKIRRLRYNYGLSREQYEKMIAEQKGKCALCNRAVRLEIDHEHNSRHVRGLLCRECNLAVGCIEISGADPMNVARYLGMSRP